MVVKSEKRKGRWRESDNRAKGGKHGRGENWYLPALQEINIAGKATLETCERQCAGLRILRAVSPVEGHGVAEMEEERQTVRF